MKEERKKKEKEKRTAFIWLSKKVGRQIKQAGGLCGRYCGGPEQLVQMKSVNLNDTVGLLVVKPNDGP